MRKMTIYAAVAFLFLSAASVQAGLNWEGEFYQFRYAVDSNGGTFYMYLNHFNEGENHTDASTELTGSYDDTVSTYNSPWPLTGIVQMDAGAQGSGTQTSPANGLVVKGYAEISLDGFDKDNHGVDVTQKVVSFVTRRFSVDVPETYFLSAHLTGTVDFNVFGQSSDHYYSSFSLAGTVQLEGYTVEAGGYLTPLPGTIALPLSDDDRTSKAEAYLVPEIDGKSVLYQLKVLLTLNTALQNSILDEIISGSAPFEGPFRLGNASSMLEVRGLLSPKPKSMPAIPLLLLDD